MLSFGKAGWMVRKISVVVLVCIVSLKWEKKELQKWVVNAELALWFNNEFNNEFVWSCNVALHKTF